MENRHRIRWSGMGSAAVLLTAALSSAAAQAAGVADLAWMSGSWSGQMGPSSTLEENWTSPKDGNISALVRAGRDGMNSMVELIVVEEVDDSLVLHIQQWDPGYQPRAAGAQQMKLEHLGDNTVTFRAVSEGGLAGLTYSRPDADTFIIEVALADGSRIPITLKAQ